jgi:hypothetical protein
MASINSGYGSYEGTFYDTKKSFDLTHNANSIFERYFDATNPGIVSTGKDTIYIPNHFFVTGEEVSYAYPNIGAGTSNAIGIAATSVLGIGITNKLPSTVYIVKISDIYVKVAASASEALKTIPSVFDITGIGTGTGHKFTSKDQNSKVLISIDNVIQSPIVATSITSLTSTKIDTIDDKFKIVGMSSFFSGDLIKIDNEIMLITSVGIAYTNVSVRRPWMGTGISSHTSGSLVTKIIGDYNIVDNTLNFVSAPYGLTPLGTTSGRPDQVDYIGISTHSTFSGRVFLRSAITDSQNKAYNSNYIFDDISPQFVGIKSQYTLKSSNSNIVGLSSNAVILINDIFQGPSKIGSIADIDKDYYIEEKSGITSISFSGFSSVSSPYDVNTVNVPRGGIIISVGSTGGFGYQPLVAAGGTAVVSASGTISSISIGNSGSGYRSGIQTAVRVGVTTLGIGTVKIQFVGIASIRNGNVVSVAITNPGIGYIRSKPPSVVFDYPLSYSNLPLIYSSSSPSGVGTQATIDITVGQGSSIINFELKNIGYKYKPGEILTVGTGGTTGIQTNTSLSFREFQIKIERTHSDKFSGWTFGDLQQIDSISNLFDGIRLNFPIKIEKELTTLRTIKGSNIDLEQCLLVFVNDILQVPGQSYSFKGGSNILFVEAPKSGDRCKLLFYRGTSSVDTKPVDIFETIKVGDTVTINSDFGSLQENERLVTDIISGDTINTNVYSGPGIIDDINLSRPLVWCRQTEDIVISGNVVTKNRNINESLINPTTNLIQSLGISSTILFVESVKTFFNSTNEFNSNNNKIKIISQDPLVSAAASVVVSSAGTISEINILNGGYGYSYAPTVSIASPVGSGISLPMTSYRFGSTIPVGLGSVASFTSTISVNGTVSSINITNAGSGYTSSYPPIVMIEPPNPKVEVISNVSYEGDFGIISGIKTTSVGVASTGIILDLYIPQNSFLRNTTIVGTAITLSGIQTGYYFVVYNSNVGKGVTSLNSTGSIVGVGSTFLDNIYRVSAVSIGQSSVPGVGVTYVTKVTVSLSNYNGLTGLGFSAFYGEYSWGRIFGLNRSIPQTFSIYNNGIVGISTSPIVQRYNPLKYQNYNT